MQINRSGKLGKARSVQVERRTRTYVRKREEPCAALSILHACLYCGVPFVEKYRNFEADFLAVNGKVRDVENSEDPARSCSARAVISSIIYRLFFGRL